MTDDEFDALRERIETLEAEVGVTGDEIPISGQTWLRVTDATGSDLYVPTHAVTGFRDTPGESMSNTKVKHTVAYAPRGSTMRTETFEDDWYASNIELLSRDEVAEQTADRRMMVVHSE